MRRCDGRDLQPTYGHLPLFMHASHKQPHIPRISGFCPPNHRVRLTACGSPSVPAGQSN